MEVEHGSEMGAIARVILEITKRPAGTNPQQNVCLG